MPAVALVLMTVVTVVATILVTFTGMLVTEVALFVLVNSDAVAIHPFGPRMCEQLAKTVGFKLSIVQISDHNFSTDHIPKNNPAVFYIHNLTCLISDPKMNVNSGGQTALQKEQSRSQHGYCTKGSDSTRKERQMKCVMVSHLTAKRDVKRDTIQVDNHTISEYARQKIMPGRPGCIRRDRDMCQSTKRKKEYYLNGTSSINCVIKAFRRLPLQLAVKKGSTKSFFLSLGSQLKLTSSTTRHGRDLLHEACLYCRLDMVRRLVDLGFDVESRDEVGKTPIITAAHKCCTDVIVFLYNIGCKITAVDRDRRNILHVAASAWVSEDVTDPIRFILTLNVSRAMLESIDSKDLQTPAHAAGKGGRLGVLELLVRKGCNLTARTGNGETMLHLAAREARVDIFSYIVSLNVSTNCTDNSGHTPLQLASKKLKEERRSYMKKRFEDVVQYLRNITKI